MTEHREYSISEKQRFAEALEELLGSGELRRKEKYVRLTDVPVQYLRTLAETAPFVTTYGTFARSISAPYDTRPEFVKVHISKLNKELRDTPLAGSIVGVWGRGYRFVSPLMELPDPIHAGGNCTKCNRPPCWSLESSETIYWSELLEFRQPDTRWVRSKKRLVLTAIIEGYLRPELARDMYLLSEEELQEWRETLQPL